jgi:hypothetical protein
MSQAPQAARRRPPLLALPLSPVADDSPVRWNDEKREGRHDEKFSSPSFSSSQTSLDPQHLPPPPPKKKKQIVAGVLSKYDFGKAWRPRLFILHPGVGLLAYYKIRVGAGGGLGGVAGGGSFGGGGEGGGGAAGGSGAATAPPPSTSTSDPDVAALLDGLRLEGEVSVIGAQVSVLESQWRRRRQQQQQQRQQQHQATPSSSSAAAAAASAPLPPPASSTLVEPAGEVALQVAGFSASRTDRRKLYVHAGTRRIAVRAETAEDRWAWLDALAAAKASLPPLASPGLRPALVSPAGSAAAAAAATAAAATRASTEGGAGDLVGGGAGASASARQNNVGDINIDDAAAPFPSPSSSAVPTARALRARLRELGVSPSAAEEAARALDDARRAASAAAHAAAAAERRELLARVARLESDKRQLETALVVERELANSSGGGGGSGGGASSPLSSRAFSPSLSSSPSSASSSGGALSPGGRLLGWARSGAVALLGGRGTGLASPSSSRREPASSAAAEEAAAAAAAGGNLLARRRQRRRLKRQLKQQQQQEQQQQQRGGATAAAGGGTATAPAVAASVAESTDDGFDEDESSDEEEEEEDEEELSSSESEDRGKVPAAAAAPAAALETSDDFFDAEERNEENNNTKALGISRPATPSWLSRARSSDAAAPVARRSALPEPEQREASVSLWSIIRECVGRDLTRVCLPVYFNEPLSALQKIAEEMEYSGLIDEARALPADSVERLLKVAAFAVSAYSGSAPSRTRKPFNPLLSETYELVRPDRGFRFVAEKVVHHPTVVAAAAEGRGWAFSGDADVRSKFWGRSIELTPAGLLTLRFDDGEEFRWKKVVTSISGLILGRLHVDHGGVMRVASSTSGLSAVLRFKEPGLFSSSSSSSSSKAPKLIGGDFEARHAVVGNQAHEVRGHVEEAKGDGSGSTARLPSPVIVGSWSESLSAVYLGGGESSSGSNGARDSTSSPTKKHVLLWRCSPPPPDPTRYCLTSFAISLNEITREEAGRMAPTDSRLRPDQRALELGRHDVANAEKQRLERKQRAARAAADRGEQIRPRWFERVNEGCQPGEAPLYRFTGEYWRCRERGEYPGCRNIFGEEEEEEEEEEAPPAAAGAGASK